VIDVLIEPIDPQNSENTIRIFQKIKNTHAPVAMATIFSSRNMNSRNLIITENNTLYSNILSPALTDALLPDLRDLFENKKSETKKYRTDDEEIEAFIELVQPSVSIVIFGGGFDARPLSELAKKIGWSVTVTDECAAHIAPIFFPSADNLSLCHREFIDRDFNLTPYTACVLMSHNYEYDRDVLKKILRSDVPYIGILGPRKRFDKMITEFSHDGILLSADDHHRIHSPIGLDIGAEAPDEIAVSIIAEIQSKFANRSGGFLKYRNAPIHQRDQRTDQVFKQVYINSKENKSANG
jgi:xanthine dehydrogenase accessory factor